MATAGPRNTAAQCSMRISVKTLMGARVERATPPWGGHSRLTPSTHARLDGLILFTMLSADTCER